MPDRLRTHDPDLVEFSVEGGGVMLAPRFQGRVFCHLKGELINRVDPALLEEPASTGFNNVGGNYVFPAPEGGPYAFNYLSGDPTWLVQEAFNTVNPRIVSRDASHVAVEKEVSLLNRKGVKVALRVRRVLRILPVDRQAMDLGLSGLRYQVEDLFTPLGRYPVTDVLLAPWSLEQFPGGPGVVSFAKVQDARAALNFDFYSDPSERVSYGDDHFLFPLGDSQRHQVGVRVAAQPRFVGALDSVRSMLFLRKAAPQMQGIYFNIADNDQPNGPYSAADLYSVFDGGELGFFELETIGAMQTDGGFVAPSRLLSETLVLHGDMQELKQFLHEREQLNLREVAV